MKKETIAQKKVNTAATKEAATKTEVKAEEAAKAAVDKKEAETVVKAAKEVKEEKAVKKAAAKKTTAKKTTARKTAEAKEAVTSHVVIQTSYSEIIADDVIRKALEAYEAEGNKTKVKNINVYIKPEENAAYYVVNDTVAGKVDIF